MAPLQRLATVAGDQGTPQFLQLLREWEEAAREVPARQVSEGDEGEERGGSREE